jgi:putative MATE family efflux protein
MRIVTVGCIFVMISVTSEKIIQATGNMRMPMISSISGALVNIALDPVLIFGLGPFPEMGVTGAAVATVIGQSVQAVLIMLILFKGKHDVKVRVKGTGFDKDTLREIYAVGFPAIIMQAIGSVMQFGMNMILAGFSTTAVAVMGVYGRLQSFVFMPVIGINQGSTPVFGYNYGARNRKRLMSAYKFALIMAFVIMGAGLILFQTQPHLLLAMFNATDDMYKIGMQALRTVSWCFLPAAFGIVSGGVFAATGHGVISLVGSLLRQMVGILPLAYILGKTGGVMAVWWSFPLAEIIGTTYIAIMMYRLYKKEFLRLDDPDFKTR